MREKVFQKSPMNETCYRSESNNVEVEARNQKKRKSATCEPYSATNRKIIPQE